MCLKPVKCIPRRYYSTAFLKNKVITTDLWAGKLYSETQNHVYYSCGKCIECVENRIESWQIRWKEHLHDSAQNSNYLITLTYNDSNIPYLYDKTTLWYSDVQKFLKRLRKKQDTYCKKNNLAKHKISYHGCGEYGTRFTKRPHYHILISNVIIDPDLIQSIWGLGKVHIGTNVNDRSIKYILKYTLKNAITNQLKERIVDENGNFQFNIIKENQKNAGRVAEKTFCSKSIGKNFATKERIEYYRKNPDSNYLWLNYTKDGKWKIKPLPRYYKELFFNPVLRTAEGKIVRDDHKRPIKLWNPLHEDFEKTPRFQKMLLCYKKQQEQYNSQLIIIKEIGEEKYIQNILLDRKIKQEKAKKDLLIRIALQLDKNAKKGAVLI